MDPYTVELHFIRGSKRKGGGNNFHSFFFQPMILYQKKKNATYFSNCAEVELTPSVICPALFPLILTEALVFPLYAVRLASGTISSPSSEYLISSPTWYVNSKTAFSDRAGLKQFQRREKKIMLINLLNNVLSTSLQAYTYKQTCIYFG